MMGCSTHSWNGQGCGALVDNYALMRVEDAAQRSISMVQPVHDIESVPVCEAVSRRAAVDVRAPRAMPPFDNSAVDGFAVRSAQLDHRGPLRLPVLATVAAGDEPRPAVSPTTPGVCRICTGAPVPPGFDAVVMQEETDMDGSFAVFGRKPAKGANIRRQGEDIAPGQVLARQGTWLDPRHIGCLAASGFQSVDVFRKPRVGVFSTGNEIAGSSDPVPPGQIPDANRPMLLSLARSAGASVTDLGIVTDDLGETTRFLTAHNGDFDLIISSGAASRGERDFLRLALERAGGDVETWRLALKPGKSVVAGKLGQTTYMGLPGNPLAAFVTFRLLVLGQLAVLSHRRSGRTSVRHSLAIAGFAASTRPGRKEYFPARVREYSAEGHPVLERLGRGSASLLPLCLADGLGCLSGMSEEIRVGDEMCWLPFVESGREFVS